MAEMDRRKFLIRSFKWSAGLGAVLAITGGGWLFLREILGWRNPGRPPWQFTLPRPVVVPHRGGAGVFPENTLEAFRGSSEQYGSRWLDLDARCTLDGVAVVLHDATVDRTTNGAGPVNEYDLAALRSLDAGFRFQSESGNFPWRGKGVVVPTLLEVLTAFPEHQFTIEVKDSDQRCIEAVVKAVRMAGNPRRVMLGSASHGAFRRIRLLAPEIPSFYSFRSAVGFYLSGWLGLTGSYRAPHQTLMAPRRLFGMAVVTPALLERARRAGIAVLVWTVNDAAEMEHFLEMGVDGLITDRPDLATPLARKYQGS